MNSQTMPMAWPASLHGPWGRVLKKAPVVSGAALQVAKIRLWARVAWMAWRRCRSIRGAGQDLRALIRRLRSLRGGKRTLKAARLRQGLGYDLFAPPSPSTAFDRFVLAELEHLRPLTDFPPIQAAFLAITSRCGLRCQHCYEWDSLNGPERLPLETLQRLALRLRDLGAAQIFFSGGEPLARRRDLVELVASLPGDIRAWIITSGQGMDDTLARDLAEAGLQGVVLSLDHWDPDLHDAFRGRPGTFRCALEAAGMARAAGLDLALSLCPTRAFMAREENLWRYAALARDLGAGLILVVEPRAAGHFAGESVELDEAALARFERFYQQVEFDPRHRDLPVFTAPSLVRRRSQCLGNGNRFLYLDPAGEVHPCQFCRGSVGNACVEDLGALVTRLRSTGCTHESCEVRTKI